MNNSSTFFVLLTFLIAFLSIPHFANAAIETIDYNYDAVKIPFAITTTSTPPGSPTTPWILEYSLLIPGTTQGYTYVPPTNSDRATIAIIPRTALKPDTYDIPIISPTITADETTTASFTSVDVTKPSDEGHIYTNTGGTNPFTSPTTITITFPSQYLNEAFNTPTQEYYFILYGCISTPTNPITSCPITAVNVVYSAFLTVPQSGTGVLPPPLAINSIVQDGAFWCDTINNQDDSIIWTMVGANIHPTGAHVGCEFNYKQPLPMTSSFADFAYANVQVIEVGSTTPSEYSYGYPTPTVIHNHIIKHSWANVDQSFTFEFLSNGPGTTFSPFDPQHLYTFRFSHHDRSLENGGFRFISFPAYQNAENYPEPGFVDTKTTDTFRIISDCELYSYCKSYTPLPPQCLEPNYLTQHRSIHNFQCDCNQLFGGAFCEFSWVPRDCERTANDYQSYDCYIRYSSSHLPDDTWARLAESKRCASITPPENGQCIPANQFIGCTQINPDPMISASTPPSKYAEFSLGSIIRCAPKEIYAVDFTTLEYKIYAIWDPNQAEQQLDTDLAVHTSLYTSDRDSLQNSTITFSLTDPTWFTPPASVLTQYPDLRPTDVRFYLSLVPLLANQKFVSFSPIYSIRSSCEWYNDICQATDSFLQCENLDSAPFTPIADFTHANCFCRPGHFLNELGTCAVFSIADHCPGGTVTRDGCCKMYPFQFIPDVARQCAQFNTGVPEITALYLSTKNDHNVANSDHIILTHGDVMTVEWATLGNLDSSDGEPILGTVWLFTSDPHRSSYDHYRLDGDIIDLDENIRSILSSFSNTQNNYYFNLTQTKTQPPTAETDHTNTPVLYPFLLSHVDIALNKVTIALPRTSLSYNSVLVLSFQAIDPTTGLKQWVFKTSTKQRIHLYPECLSLQFGSVVDPADTKLHPTQIPSINGADMCATGHCDVIRGECQCPELYKSLIPFPPEPNLCQVDVCSGHLICLNGHCDSKAMQCVCDEGWEGKHCDISSTCNPDFKTLSTAPLDEFEYTPAPNKDGVVKHTKLPNQCSRYGHLEQDWFSGECQDECTCFDGHVNAPYCDKCDITCHHRTLADIHGGCTKCICTRYNEGPFCACHRLPLSISIVYPLLTSDDNDINTDNNTTNPSLSDGNANINNELRILAVETIQMYYDQRDADGVYDHGVTVSTSTDGASLIFNITTPNFIGYFQQILIPEFKFESTPDSLQINYILVSVTTSNNNDDDTINSDNLSTFIPKTIQINSISIDLALVDNCTLIMADSNFDEVVSSAQQFIQSIRFGSAVNQRIWGTYREYVQYAYEYIIAPVKRSDTISLTTIPSRNDAYKFTPTIPTNLNELTIKSSIFSEKTREKINKDYPNLTSIQPNTPITMVQFDPIFYKCVSGNTVPNHTNLDDFDFHHDYILNSDGNPIHTISPLNVTLSVDMTCFDNSVLQLTLFVNIIVIIAALFW